MKCFVFSLIFAACFRRALAGKRVAPQWVRRTLRCERVEDCQVVCGIEKRFTCEGFNYRLDPSGRGQGVCELIDCPLSQMDIYSSAHNRDENLLFHPDYDYYERDRNSCRPSICTDCGSSSEIGSGHGSSSHDGGSHVGGKPYLPEGPPEYLRPTTYRPIDNYRPRPESRPPNVIEPSGYGSAPDRFRPHDTAVDKYRPPIFDSHRPHIYESKPQDYDRYDVVGPSKYPPPLPQYRPQSYDLDRYDNVNVKPIESSRPEYPEISIYKDNRYNSRPEHYGGHDDYRPPYRPTSTGNEYLGPYKPHHEQPPPSFTSFGYRPPMKPEHFALTGPSGPPEHPSNYYERENERDRNSLPPPPRSHHRKPGHPFIPYSINKETSYGSYSGRYGESHQQGPDYWGLKKDIVRKDEHKFNYFNLGPPKYNPNENSVLSYPGSKYENDNNIYQKDKNYYGNLWTRRPGPDGTVIFKLFVFL